jgi:hypothetical protein
LVRRVHFHFQAEALNYKTYEPDMQLQVNLVIRHRPRRILEACLRLRIAGGNLFISIGLAMF